MVNNNFILISGFLNLAGGIFLLVYWYAFAIFLPYGKLSDTLAILVENRNWTWINGLGALGALCGLLGQAGIYFLQVDQVTWISSVGYYIAVAGTTLLIGTMIWESVLWPILVRHDRNLLGFQGPIYTSKTFVPFFVIAGLVYSVGYILVGIGIIQAGILPRMIGYLLAIGAPTFGFGSMFGKFQVYPRSLGVTLMSAGLIWIGLIMLF
jgi:hypothetical protein